MSTEITERPTTTADEGVSWKPVLAEDEASRRDELAKVIERVAIIGDLSKISASDRIRYYARLCESLGLNPLTRPFEYIYLNNKLTLYAKRDGTDQIRAQRRISIDVISRSEDKERGLYAARVSGSLPDGRRDEATGIVSIKGLSGQDLANAMMKAETKGKRRLTLSLAGLGFLDETEIADTPDARPVDVDPDTGAILHTYDENGDEVHGLDRLRGALDATEANDESTPDERSGTDAMTPEPDSGTAEEAAESADDAASSAPAEQLAIDPIGDALAGRSRRRKPKEPTDA